MAMTHDIQIARQGNGFFAAIKEAIARRKVYNQTLNELRQLSNRELNDLGLSRSVITRVAAEAAYGK